MSRSAKMTRLITIPILILLVFLAACSSRDGKQTLPTSPEWSEKQIQSSGHESWGYWEGFIPDTHDSLELIPIRTAIIHLNARHLLEDTVCTDCITILSFEVDEVEGIMRADIQLTHPYPGYNRYTGFDVRTVIISDGSLIFPELDAVVPHQSMGDFTLINPDGYTRLWNTIEFPPGSGPFEILEYSQGTLASPGDFTGTVNPFIEYSIEPRDHFPVGGSITRTLEFNLVPGPMKFGYAVDASWMQPIVEPVTDIWTDFQPSANALEPSVLSVYMSDDFLTDQIGDEAWLHVKIRDRQNALVYVLNDQWELEAPDIWNGLCQGDQNYSCTEEYLNHTIRDRFLITNEYGVESGEYLALLKVQDPMNDFWLGDVNHLYELLTIEVKEYLEPEFNGRIVFSAPNITQPPLPPTGNVWFYDFSTGEEIQLTGFGGVGILWHEPRINPAGTLMMITMGPTPTSGNAVIYEIDGPDSWSCSSDACDDWNDFHPDGEHILVASGIQWGNTPELYSMKLDGSERTLIATASDTISNPRWNPDGTKIAMVLGYHWDTSESQLWIYDVASDEFTHIMAADGIVDHPSWSPVPIDGHYLLAFDSNRDHHPDNETDIFVINPDTEEILCKLDTGVNETHPSFSPDGLSLVFSMTPESENDPELFLYSWQTEDMTQLTDDDTYDGSPSWGWNW